MSFKINIKCKKTISRFYKMTNQQYQTPFPPPPNFYKLYTKENLKEAPLGPFEVENVQLDSLRPPPSLSIDEEYKVFGLSQSVNYSILQSIHT